MTGADITRMTNKMRDHAKTHASDAEKLKDVRPEYAQALLTASIVLHSLAVAFGCVDGDKS